MSVSLCLCLSLSLSLSSFFFFFGGGGGGGGGWWWAEYFLSERVQVKCAEGYVSMDCLCFPVDKIQKINGNSFPFHISKYVLRFGFHLMCKQSKWNTNSQDLCAYFNSPLLFTIVFIKNKNKILGIKMTQSRVILRHARACRYNQLPVLKCVWVWVWMWV